MATPHAHQHQFFGGSVCALCGSQSAQSATETRVDPQAFRDGEWLAYDRVLQYLATLGEQVATTGRDQGRGVAHVTRDLTAYVTALRDDL